LRKEQCSALRKKAEATQDRDAQAQEEAEKESAQEKGEIVLQ